MNWNLVQQPEKSNLCGQSCVATACNMTLDGAVKAVGKRGLTNTRDLVKVLANFYKVGNRMVRVSSLNKLPEAGLLKIKWKNKDSHWILIKNGIVYDPSFDTTFSLFNYTEWLKEFGKITSFLTIRQTQA